MKKITNLFTLLLAMIVMGSCAHQGASQNHTELNKNQGKESFEIDDLTFQDPNAQDSVRFYSSRTQQIKQLKVSSKLKERINFWLHRFSGEHKKSFQRLLNNSHPYRSLVLGILKEHRLPSELFYLPVIESGYFLHARSRVGATGPWQFMRSTGRQYGLEVSRYVDERLNIIKSSQAAAAHLRDLYNIFGSWELALAAYNAGISRIMGLIIKGNHREYWKLSELNLLPSETADYIPKFLAAIMIGENPEAYGFEMTTGPEDFKQDYTVVEVDGPLSLKDIAREIRVPLKELKKLNLEYKRGFIPRQRERSELIIPGQSLASFQKSAARLRKIAKATKRPRKQVAKARPSEYYRVKKGDTLSAIASKFNIKISELARVNNLGRHKRVYAGQKLLLSSEDFSGIYKVKRGDNLSSIAKRFGASIKNLKQINGLRSHRIYPGQRLRVAASGRDYYIVQKGDTLWEIALKNGVKVRSLISLNSLKTTRIFEGQKLLVKN